MRIECPACSATGNVDGTRVPKEGRHVTCPRCRNRFQILPERSGVEIIEQRETMVCPRCGSGQPPSESCASCGIVFRKYLQAVERQREMERLELHKLKSEVQAVDSWYGDLFDRRLSSLMVRVLSLLVGVAVVGTCSARNAIEKQALVEEMQRADQGSVRPPPDDKRILPELKAFEGHVKNAAYQCMNQCDRYSLAWYDKGEPGMNMYREHVLTEEMQEALLVLRAVKRTIDGDFRRLPTPSKQYWPYYYKVKGLYHAYVSLYDLANSPDNHYYDFRGFTSRGEGELRRILTELDSVRPL